MSEVEPLAVAFATITAFLLGGAYYAVLGRQLAGVSTAAATAADSSPAPYELAAELLRCLVLAAVVAGLAARGEVDAPVGGLLLGAALWVGFPLVLWTGAVIHEKAPVKLAAIHAGDWLLKLLAIGLIVGAVR
jgi:uncharacterized protein DUF1761